MTVLTGKPNYPDGNIFKGYQLSGIQHEQLPSGVQIHRVPLRPRLRGGKWNIALNYLSFLFSGLFRFPSLVKRKEFDVILFFAPSPLTSAITALPLKYLTHSHLAIWVQDLWPESLSATGYVHNRAVLYLIRRLVRMIYGSADTLLIQSQAFQEPVSALTDPKKVIYYPNFSKTIAAPAVDEINSLPAPLQRQLEENFCVVFTGNLGIAQALDSILEAARQLRDLSRIKFLLVGSGSQSAWLGRQIEKIGLANLILTGRLPPEQMPVVYQHADALLVTLKADKIFTYTVPSKVQGYLASGRPIIACANGETARIITDSGAGIVCPAEDPSALAGAIRTLYHTPVEQRDAMGERGLRYFMTHFEMESQIRILLDLLRKRIKSGKT